MNKFSKIKYCTEALKRFIRNEYRWVIATIIAIPASIAAYQGIKFDNRSDSFYYAPPFFEGKDTNSLSEADCWIGSISTNRSDAFRCSSDNFISDPCFEDPITFSTVTCPSNPNDKNPARYKAKIDSKYRNDPEKNPGFNSPWYIIMSDGSECRILTGTSIIVADKRYDYSCVGGEEISDLSLPVKQKDGKMYISCVIGNRIVEDCLIKEAWY